MKLTDFISDIGRPVAFYPGLRKITGSTTATLFLCQLIYWDGKQTNPEGWIYKTSDEIEYETGLSYDEQVTARKNLVRAGFIEEKYKRLEHKMYFRISKNAINEKWRNRESPTREPGDANPGIEANPVSLITESTAETTKENKEKEIHSTQTSEIPLSTSPRYDPMFDPEPEQAVEQEAFQSLSDYFSQATNILLYRPDEWCKAIREMVVNGIDVDLMEASIVKLRAAKMTITGPWSIVKTAIGIKADSGIAFVVSNG